MSGGHFDYKCYHISQFAEELLHEIEVNDDVATIKEDEFGASGAWVDDAVGYGFEEATIEDLKVAHIIIELAGKLAREIEWLYSGDHSEESYRRLHQKLLEAWELPLKAVLKEPMLEGSDG